MGLRAIVLIKEGSVTIAMDLSNWLFGEIDRERLLDMDRRLRPVRRNALGVLAATLMISAPWTGWWTLAPLLVAAGLSALASAEAKRSMRCALSSD
jgi:hypothetical protein